MLRLRRNDHDLRVEMTPLMDVIFLLLTFFIYVTVLMTPPMLLPASMQQFISGEPAKPAPAVTVSIDAAGNLYCDREPIELDAVADRLQQIKAQRPETVIYIAAEAEGDADRLPIFLALYDRLAFAGLEIKLVGAPPEQASDRSVQGDFK